MIDPIHAHLCLLLLRYDVVADDDVCFWSSTVTERACLAAGLRRVDAGTWTHGPTTAEWVCRTWDEIRRSA